MQDTCVWVSSWQSSVKERGIGFVHNDSSDGKETDLNRSYLVKNHTELRWNSHAETAKSQNLTPTRERREAVAPAHTEWSLFIFIF